VNATWFYLLLYSIALRTRLLSHLDIANAGEDAAGQVL